MDTSTFWWMAAGALVVAELLTGTFYLLMLAVGAAAAALAAHAGLGMTAQVITAAVVGGAGVVLWSLKNKRQHAGTDASDTHIHLDIGATVTVDAWDAQGLTHVKHRGAVWAATCQAGTQARPDAAALSTVSPLYQSLPQSLSAGLHKIVAVQGSRLVLEKI